MSGWRILRKAGALETIFKFHRTAKLDANSTVMVWSADIGATHEPPSNVVMKGQKWFVADNMTTILLNNDGEICLAATSGKINALLLREISCILYSLYDTVYI